MNTIANLRTGLRVGQIISKGFKESPSQMFRTLGSLASRGLKSFFGSDALDRRMTAQQFQNAKDMTERRSGLYSSDSKADNWANYTPEAKTYNSNNYTYV